MEINRRRKVLAGAGLATGDAVRYSVRSGTSTIDKLHAGDEAKDAPPPGAA